MRILTYQVTCANENGKTLFCNLYGKEIGFLRHFPWLHWLTSLVEWIIKRGPKRCRRRPRFQTVVYLVEKLRCSRSYRSCTCGTKAPLVSAYCYELYLPYERESRFQHWLYNLPSLTLHTHTNIPLKIPEGIRNVRSTNAHLRFRSQEILKLQLSEWQPATWATPKLKTRDFRKKRSPK